MIPKNGGDFKYIGLTLVANWQPDDCHATTKILCLRTKFYRVLTLKSLGGMVLKSFSK